MQSGKYSKEELRSDFIDSLNDIEPNPIFAIPGPNIFMPEDFRLQPFDPDDIEKKHPNLVYTDGVVKVRFLIRFMGLKEIHPILPNSYDLLT